jgi:hypothetical protein
MLKVVKGKQNQDDLQIFDQLEFVLDEFVLQLKQHQISTIEV